MAGVHSNALVKMNTPYGCYPLRSLTLNQKHREIEMRDGKALYFGHCQGVAVWAVPHAK